MQPLADNLPQILNFTQDLYPQLRCFVSNREIMKIIVQIDVVTICQIYHKLTFKIAMLCHDICNQNSIKRRIPIDQVVIFHKMLEEINI